MGIIIFAKYAPTNSLFGYYFENLILWVFLDFENLILDFSIFSCRMGMKKVMEMGFNIHLCLIVGMF